MNAATSRKGEVLVGTAITLALISTALSPAARFEQGPSRSLPLVFMALCCFLLYLGSDHARGFIAMYLALFGGLAVIGLPVGVLLADAGWRPVLPAVGGVIGLAAAAVLCSSTQLREFVRSRREARNRAHAKAIRVAWILFAVYLAVILYFEVAGPA